MTAVRINIALAGPRSGYVVAVMPPAGQEDLAPSRQTRRGTTLVTGSVYRVSADGEPPAWKAYLWPVAGGDMHVTQSCGAAEAGTPQALEKKLQKRADSGCLWWGKAGEVA